MYRASGKARINFRTQPCPSYLLIALFLVGGPIQRNSFESIRAADVEASDEAIQGTANELYMKARAFEDQKQLLHALRTFRTGHRLVPTDSRFKKKLQQLAGMLKGNIQVDGCSTRLPVLVPHGARSLTPGSPGSADDLVATFFKWQRIPIFRNDSDQCAIHSAGHETIFTVMGHTCLSSSYVAAHNLVQGIFSGEAEGSWISAIPNASRVTCKEECGVDIPPYPPFLTRRVDPSQCPSVLWAGMVAGQNIDICRGEARPDALTRLISSGRLSEGLKAQANDAMVAGVIETLLAERPRLLSSAGPYFHRSQIIAGDLAKRGGSGVDGDHETVASEGRKLQTIRTAQRKDAKGDEMQVQWDVANNRLQPEEVDADAEAAQRFLWEYQHPADCTARTALVYHHNRAYWGFAANVHFMIVAFNHAMAFNRTFLTRNPDHWNYGGRDCRAGWECYFEPVSSCGEVDVWEPYTVPVRADFRWDHRGYLYRVDTRTQRVLSYANVDGPWQEAIGNSRHPSGVSVRKWIPEQFRHRGLLWWRAQVTRYLLRPKAFVLDFVNQRTDAVGLMHRARSIVGLHVRHGDKAYDMYQGSFFGSIDSYLDKAKTLLPSMDAVYVSTDDPSVVAALPQTEQKRSLQCLHDSLERRYNGTHIYAPPGISLARWPAFPGNDPMVNTTMYALETIKSIWILSLEVPAFVGTVTSSMSRLIYQMRVAFGQPVLQDEWTVDKDLRHDKGWFADP